MAESMESASQDVKNLSPEKKKAAASARSMTPEQRKGLMDATKAHIGG